MIARVLLVAALVGITGAIAVAGTGDDDLTAAIAMYREALDATDPNAQAARFADAQRRFRRAIDAGVGENADLFANLGNAALGAESIGEAMWAYQRALVLDPSHRRANANVAHIRRHLPSWVPRPQDDGVLDTFFFWRRTLSTRARTLAGAASFLLCALLVGTAWVTRRAWLRWLAVVPLLAWIALVVVPAVEALGDPNAAVVTAPDAALRTADAAGAPVKMVDPLPGGTEVVILETRTDWVRIRLADGRDGWVRASQVRSVGP